MVAEVFGGIAAFKAMLDIAKSIKDMNDVTARQGAIIELREQILAAQTAQFALIEQVSAFKEEVAKFEKWDAEKQQYELKDLGWEAFAFMLKPEARKSEPPHWICTNCFRDRENISRGPDRGHFCPACKTKIQPQESLRWLNQEQSNHASKTKEAN
jgi:hypothetical protein